MKVKMVQSRSTAAFGLLEAGATVDLPDEKAQAYVDAGVATKPAGRPKKKPETDTEEE